MDALIEALQIFRKYDNPDYPTHCEHDELTVCVAADAVTDPADVQRLDALGFFSDADFDCWKSFRFGSA